MRFVSTRFRIRTVRNAICAGLLAIAAGTSSAHAAATYSVLYRFSGDTNGKYPAGSLVRDSSGALYGTTSYGGYGFGFGTVFKLTPPAAGKTTWTQTVIYRFKGIPSDGWMPKGALMIDSAGALYGTTELGGKGDNGTVFKLTPPTAGKKAWTETVLYMFQTSSSSVLGDFLVDAANPEAGVILVNGSLYGTASQGGLHGKGCGAVYKLTPPPAGSKQKTWTETIIHTLGGSDGSSPLTELVADATGALYGTARYGEAAIGCYISVPSGGTVFKLVPPAAGKTAWGETILHRFTGKIGDAYYPSGRLTFGANGVLYGAGGGNGGAVFSLTPPATGKTAWTETVLHAFNGYAGSLGDSGPDAVTVGPGGILYGTTQQGGTIGHGAVFKLTPPGSAGQNWTATVLHSFTGEVDANRDGASPWGPLVLDKNGQLFGTSEYGGGPDTNYGTVFKVTP